LNPVNVINDDTYEPICFGKEKVATAIGRLKVAAAIGRLKFGKAAGEDVIRPEMLKALSIAKEFFG